MNNSKSDSYSKAGVDINAGYEAVKRMQAHIKNSFRSGVIGKIGGFGGLFEPNLRGFERPVFVSGTDGVGTKLKIAFMLDKHDTIGVDCVAMCVNDIVCSGAEPLFFLDYIATGKIYPERIERIVAGIADGCRQAGCALIGGETAEHPGMMPTDEYDVAGFCVGVVDYDKIIDGNSIEEGDAIVGLASSGLHSNGFSLVRCVFKDELENLDTHDQNLGCTLGEELLRPTKIYVKPLLSVIKRYGRDIKGISNITGGGFYENIPRMLPNGIRANIDAAKLPQRAIFQIIAEKGKIPMRDMYNTFNMGIGIALVVSKHKAESVIVSLSELEEEPVNIGTCVKGERGVNIMWK